MELDIMRIMMFLVRTIPAILFVFLIAIVMFSFSVEIEEKDVDRLSIETAEGLLSSPLVTSRAVFSESILEESSTRYGADNGANFEPYARPCKSAYYVKVSDLSSRKTWEFGYRPSGITEIDEPSVIAYPAGIFVSGLRPGEFYNTVKPALMVVEIHDSWLTRATCLAEKALATREVEEMILGCIDLRFLMTGPPIELSDCGFSIVRPASRTDHLCIFDRNYGTNPSDDLLLDCRYVPEIAVRQFSKGYDNEAKLRAVPVIPGTLVDCENIEALESLVAKTGLAEIVFCLEGL